MTRNVKFPTVLFRRFPYLRLVSLDLFRFVRAIPTRHLYSFLTQLVHRGLVVCGSRNHVMSLCDLIYILAKFLELFVNNVIVTLFSIEHRILVCVCMNYDMVTEIPGL